MIELSTDFRRRCPADASFDWFMGLTGEVFRDMPDRKTLRFEVGGGQYFIKIHTGVGWGEIFKNLLQGRLPVIGAKNEWRAIKRLDQLGVRTMKLAGYGCEGRNPARQRSFVVTEALTNTVSLEDFCADWPADPPPVRLKRALIRHVAMIAKTLHDHGLNHRDFYICHFLLKTPVADMDQPVLHLIDLHRVQIRNETPRRWVIKDLAALHFSSLNIGLTARDRLRFIRAYRGSSLRDTLTREKAFWDEVERRALRLLRSPKSD